MLPNDVLLEIFFYVNIRDWSICPVDPWHTLVHVCRRWRHLVFASPQRLKLRLMYRGYRPISKVLDVWPVLPVSLISLLDQSDQQWDNFVAALESENSNRICEIHVRTINRRWERFAAAMQKPFPELTRLEVWMLDGVRVLSDSFLGGSAPRLRSLEFGWISFPSIPKLLLSANGLVKLNLEAIPDSGYFSPHAIATALTAMTRLEFLRLEFRSPRSPPDPESRPLPPPTRSVLPVLTKLEFKGVYKYLEVLLARIDPPCLYHLDITFFMDLGFDVPQLHRLIGNAEEFKTFHRANVWIFNLSIQLRIYHYPPWAVNRQCFGLNIICRELDDRLSSLCQICNLSFPLISALEELQIREGDSGFFSSSHWKSDRKNAQWLELLAPFTGLKNLYLPSGIARCVCGALQEISGERVSEVLPALRNLFVRGSSLEPIQEAVKPFVAARQLSGHPVVVDHWKD